MSTRYYRLKEPITSLRVDEDCDVGRKQLYIFVNHELAGKLILYPHEIPDTLLMFCKEETEYGCAVTVANGVHEHLDRLDPETRLVSEYGELTTVREVREKANESRVTNV